jgi:hypothetical protein
MTSPDVQLAAQVRSWLDRGEHRRVNDSPLGKPHEEIARVFPDARRFGVAVLAAAPRSGMCRWDIAFMNARAYGTKPPAFNRATRLLLGDPCENCVRTMRANMKARVGSGRLSQIRAAGSGRRAGVVTRRGAPPSTYGLVASVANGGSCCETWRATQGRLHWNGCFKKRR